jgi:uncharacterized glyoxalase superfamily protein PhnB
MTDYGQDPQVIPYLLYADAGAAMDWLIAAFGFTERVRDLQDDGTMRHGELLLDHGGVIMLGSAGADFRGPATLGEVTQLQCITITDLAAHRERAQAAGAHVSEIAIRANRAHSYTVDDPEGHRWYFSEPLLASSACGESSCWDGVRVAPSVLTARSGYGQRLACQAPGRRAAAHRGSDLGPQAGRRAAARHGPAD